MCNMAAVIVLEQGFVVMSDIDETHRITYTLNKKRCYLEPKRVLLLSP